jgi:hypothetical protein
VTGITIVEHQDAFICWAGKEVGRRPVISRRVTVVIFGNFRPVEQRGRSKQARVMECTLDVKLLSKN